MLVWLLMLGSIIAVWFILPDGIGEKKKKLIFLGFSLGIIVFVLGSRYVLGVEVSDLYSYYRWYHRAIELPLNELLEFRLEKGYLVLNEILAWIVPWEQFIFYFQAAFCTGVMLWYIYRNVDDVFLAVIVYVCIGPWQFFLTAFRQSIATCICFIAYELAKKQKTRYDIIALALIMLASTMHTTAWVFLVIFVIRYLKPGKGMIVFTGISTIVLLVFMDDLVSFGNDALGRDYAYGFYAGNAFGGLIPILIYVAALILCYLVWRYDRSITEDYAMDIEMLIFGLCLYVLRYNTSIFERISFYFTPVISVVLPVAITKQKKENERKICTAVCVALCVGLYMYRTLQQFGELDFYWNHLME